MPAYSREEWNDIIKRVNDLAENPDDGCDPLEPLEEVDPNHVWSVDDIEKVRDKLKEICEDTEFEEELKLWSQKVIDEIEEALAAGWCKCEEECDDEDTVFFTYEFLNQRQHFTLGANDEVPTPCGTTGLSAGHPQGVDADCNKGFFDWWSIAQAYVGPGEGTMVAFRRTVPTAGGPGNTVALFSNQLNEDGTQAPVLNPPTPGQIEEGGTYFFGQVFRSWCFNDASPDPTPAPICGGGLDQQLRQTKDEEYENALQDGFRWEFGIAFICPPPEQELPS